MMAAVVVMCLTPGVMSLGARSERCSLLECRRVRILAVLTPRCVQGYVVYKHCLPCAACTGIMHHNHQDFSPHAVKNTMSHLD